MSAIINIFDSAFTDEHRRIKVESGLRLEEVEPLDWDNTLIFVNGFERTKDYIVRDDDIITVRQYPSDSGARQVMSWLFFPVASTIYYYASGGNDEGIINGAVRFVDSIKSLFDQLNKKTNDIGSGEQIPTVSGAKNRSGANQPIPLLLGKTMYTPITQAQYYTTISGADGENQILHALYNLGYKDIDVKSVSLGIYKLTTDRHNGTSGSLDCTNVEPEEETVEIPVQVTNMPVWFNNTSLVQSCNLNIYSDKYNVLGINSILSASISASLNSSKYGSLISGNTRQVCQGEVRPDGDKLVYTTTAENAGFHWIDSADIFITALAKIKAGSKNTHYPLYDTSTRKGYYQKLELQQGANISRSDGEVGLYPQKVIQENFGVELMHPEGVQALILQPFSAKYPQKIELEVMFQNLVKYNEKGEQKPTKVELCVGYSLDGGNTFLPFNAFTAPSGSEISVTNEGTYTDEYGSYRVTKFEGKKNKNLRYVATKTFSFNDVFNIPEGTVKCKNNVIEFKIWRKTEDKSATDSKYQYKCSFASIRTWTYDYDKTLEQYESGTSALVPQAPIIQKYRDMTARLGFEIRAGDEIKGVTDELNVVMQSRARYCTRNGFGGSLTWSGTGAPDPYDPQYTRPTSNPASLALMVLQHPMRGEYAYSDDELDMASFAEFYNWCSQIDYDLIDYGQGKYSCNGVLSRQMKTSELVNQILNCGHGKLIVKNGKYAVIYDKPNQLPVMILNNQNVIEAKNTKNFDEDIDGYSCKFIDALNDYQEDTQIFVPNDITKPKSEWKLESIELPWITDAKRAYRFCMYLLACRRLRPETWERKLGVDGNLVDVGSLVEVQDDTLLVGIGDGAQITELVTSGNTITGIKVDYGFTVTDASKTYGVKIQHSDPTHGVSVNVYRLASFNTAGVYKTLTFRDPISQSTTIKPAEGDIVSFGIYGKETTDAVCLSKKANGDGTFTLILSPYQDNIYESEYGNIPQFETNVTSPRDAGTTIDEEIPKPSYEDVGNIAQAVADEGSDVPPSPPATFDVTAFQDYIELKCTHIGTTLTECVKYYEFQIQKGSAEPFVIQSGSPNFDYVFKRDVDGFPEITDLQNWSFKCRVVNVYDVPSSDWEDAVTDTIDTSRYGTWQPAVPSFYRKEAIEEGIAFEWQQATSSISGKNLYGSNEYEVKVFYNGTQIASHRTTGLNYVYAFDRSTDGYPEKPSASVPSGTKTLDNYTVTLKVINSSAKNATTSASAITYANYKTWIPPEITVAKEIVDRTVILSALYNGEVYGNQKLLVKISRVGNKDLVDTESQQTFNDLLGIEEDVDQNDDRIFYTPEFDKSVQTSDTADNEPNYRKSTQTPFEHIGYKITHTLPLIGQTYRIFKEGNVYTDTFTKDVEDYSSVPSTPTEGLIIHYTGNGEEQGGVTFEKNFYYLYEDSDWQQVFSKALIVPTTYIYSIQMTNESGNLSNLLDDIEATAQPTNISDIVHSHEHYKDLYVEKLSAINANLGMISQGGMGEFKDWKNFWALSDLSAEDSGVAGGVKKGSFRVGGDDQFLEVMPDPDHEGEYLITLQAGNITLTSGSDASFKQGTYIYDKIDPKKRLALTSTGMIAQQDVSVTQGVEDWVNMAEVRTDELGNMVITNSDDAPVVGVGVTGTIYHFDDSSHPFYEEVEEGQSASNPEGLSGDGAIAQIDADAIIKEISSSKCYAGTVQKSIGSYTGTMVLFSKSNMVKPNDEQMIRITGAVDDSNAEAYNNLMSQTKGSGTVGSYLGLTSSQISSGIFKSY